MKRKSVIRLMRYLRITRLLILCLIFYMCINYSFATRDMQFVVGMEDSQWSIPVQISSTPQSAIDFAMHVDDDNTLHLTWTEEIHGMGALFYSSKPFNGIWSIPELLAKYQSWSGNQLALDMTVDKSGAVHVVWHERGSGYGYEMAVQRGSIEKDFIGVHYATKPKGGTWSTPIRLACVDEVGLATLGILMNSSEEGLVVYTGFNWSSAHEAVKAQVNFIMKTPYGWSPPLTLTSDVYFSSLTMDELGVIHFSWANENRTQILYMSKSPGVDWLDPIVIYSGTSSLRELSMAIDTSGVPHLICSEYFDIFHMSKEGVNWTDPVRLITPAAAIWPYTAADEEGIHVVWDSVYVGDDVFYAQWKSNEWTNPINLSQSSGTVLLPKIFTEPNGDITVMWRDTTCGGDRITYLQKVKDQEWGVLQEGPFIGDDAQSPRFVIDAQRNIIHLVWFTLAGNEVYYSARLANGSWSEQEIVNYGQNPSICLDNNGIVHIMYHWKPSGYWIFHHCFKGDQGDWVKEPALVQSDPSLWAFAGETNLAVSKSGDIYAYLKKPVDSSIEYYYIVKPKGENWSEPIYIESRSKTWDSLDTVEEHVDMHGNLHKVWTQSTSLGTWEVFYSRTMFKPRILSPKEGEIISINMVNISWERPISEFGSDYFEVIIDNQLMASLNLTEVEVPFEDGQHYIEVAHIDKVGNTVIGSTIFFVDLSPPEILEITQEPRIVNFWGGVRITAILLDSTTSVSDACLYYSIDGSIWTSVNMTKQRENVFVGNIPRLLSGKALCYITASDEAGNLVVSQEMKYFIDWKFLYILVGMCVLLAFCYGIIKMRSRGVSQLTANRKQLNWVN